MPLLRNSSLAVAAAVGLLSCGAIKSDSLSEFEQPVRSMLQQSLQASGAPGGFVVVSRGDERLKNFEGVASLDSGESFDDRGGCRCAASPSRLS